MTNERKRRQTTGTAARNGASNTNNTSDTTPEEESLSFEEAVRRLDEAVSQLEGGQLPLEDALRIFEEGTRLAQRCQTMLDNAELRVQRLRRNDVQDDAEALGSELPEQGQAAFLLETFEFEEDN